MSAPEFPKWTLDSLQTNVPKANLSYTEGRHFNFSVSTKEGDASKSFTMRELVDGLLQIHPKSPEEKAQYLYVARQLKELDLDANNVVSNKGTFFDKASLLFRRLFGGTLTLNDDFHQKRLDTIIDFYTKSPNLSAKTKEGQEARRACFYAAQAGVPEAMYEMGMISLSPPADEKEATHWLTKAAEQGNHQAQYQLSKLLIKDRNVTADQWRNSIFEKGTGFYWLNQAKRNGNVDAMLDTVLLFENMKSLEGGENPVIEQQIIEDLEKLYALPNKEETFKDKRGVEALELYFKVAINKIPLSDQNRQSKLEEIENLIQSISNKLKTS